MGDGDRSIINMDELFNMLRNAEAETNNNKLVETFNNLSCDQWESDTKNNTAENKNFGTTGKGFNEGEEAKKK